MNIKFVVSKDDYDNYNYLRSLNIIYQYKGSLNQMMVLDAYKNLKSNKIKNKRSKYELEKPINKL